MSNNDEILSNAEESIYESTSCDSNPSNFFQKINNFDLNEPLIYNQQQQQQTVLDDILSVFESLKTSVHGLIAYDEFNQVTVSSSKNGQKDFQVTISLNNNKKEESSEENAENEKSFDDYDILKRLKCEINLKLNDLKTKITNSCLTDCIETVDVCEENGFNKLFAKRDTNDSVTCDQRNDNYESLNEEKIKQNEKIYQLEIKLDEKIKSYNLLKESNYKINQLNDELKNKCSELEQIHKKLVKKSNDEIDTMFSIIEFLKVQNDEQLTFTKNELIKLTQLIHDIPNNEQIQASNYNLKTRLENFDAYKDEILAGLDQNREYISEKMDKFCQDLDDSEEFFSKNQDDENSENLEFSINENLINDFDKGRLSIYFCIKGLKEKVNLLKKQLEYEEKESFIRNDLLNRTIKRLEDESKKQTAFLQEKINYITQLEKDLESKNSEIKSFKEDINQKQINENLLKDENVSLHLSNKELNDNAKKMLNQEHNLKQLFVKMKNERDQLKRDLESKDIDYKNNLQHVESHKNQLIAENEHLKIGVETLKKMIFEIQNVKMCVDIQLNDATQKLSASEKLLYDLHVDIFRMTQIINEFSFKNSDSINRFTIMEKQNTELQLLNARLDSELKSNIEKIECLKSEISYLNNEHSRKEQTLNDFKLQVSKTTNSLIQSEKELHEANNKYENLLKENKRLNQKLKETKICEQNLNCKDKSSSAQFQAGCSHPADEDAVKYGNIQSILSEYKDVMYNGIKINVGKLFWDRYNLGIENERLKKCMKQNNVIIN